MGAFDVNGEYKVEVAATDYFGTPAPKNLLYKVIVGGLDLSSTFDETILSAIYEVGDEVKVPYVARVGDKQQKIKTVFTEKFIKIVTLCSLLFYAGIKCYSFYTGANHIPTGIPLGQPGAILSSGLILPLNIAVGLVVTCTMYSFYSLFSKGEI
jgi:hypothetical protein